MEINTTLVRQSNIMSPCRCTQDCHLCGILSSNVYVINLIVRKPQEVQTEGASARCLTSTLHEGQDHERQRKAEELPPAGGDQRNSNCVQCGWNTWDRERREVEKLVKSK